MKNLFRKTSAFIAIAALGSIAIQAAPAAMAEGYAAPTAPIVTDIIGVKGGIKVTWAKSASQSPAITNYIVSAGAGSCPVIVGANQTSAVMPALTRDELQVSVQAVDLAGNVSLDSSSNELLVSAISTDPLAPSYVRVVSGSDSGVSSSDSITLAPRSLKLPVGMNHSHFSRTLAPCSVRCALEMP